MYRETCCENTSRNSQNFLNNRNWPNYASTLLSRRILEKDNNPSILHCTWWRRNWWNEDILSRVHITSKWRSIPRETVDSWKHEGRPSLGCEFLLSSRTLQCWDHGRIFVSRPNSFLGSHRERNQQIRDRSVRRNSCCKRWAWMYRETCREGWTTTNAYFNIVSCFYSLWKHSRGVDMASKVVGCVRMMRPMYFDRPRIMMQSYEGTFSVRRNSRSRRACSSLWNRGAPTVLRSARVVHRSNNPKGVERLWCNVHRKGVARLNQIMYNDSFIGAGMYSDPKMRNSSGPKASFVLFARRRAFVTSLPLAITIVPRRR